MVFVICTLCLSSKQPAADNMAAFAAAAAVAAALAAANRWQTQVTAGCLPSDRMNGRATAASCSLSALHCIVRTVERRAAFRDARRLL